MKSDIKITEPAKLSKPHRFLYFASIGTIIAAGLLIILGLVSYVQNQSQQAALDEQTQKTTQLIGQVKDLTEQNKRLAQLAVNYQYCNAQTWAKYTRDKEPVTIEDLEKCVVKSFPQNEGAPTIEELKAMASGESYSSNKQVASNQTSGSSGGSGSSKPQTPTTPNNPNNPQTPTQNRPTNNLLTLKPTLLTPGLQVNTPCVQVTMLLGTCKTF